MFPEGSPFLIIPKEARKPLIYTILFLGILGNLIEGIVSHDIAGFVVVGILLVVALYFKFRYNFDYDE